MSARSITRTLLVTGTLVLLIGCTDPYKLPWAPSELTTGIAVYEHANYLGAAGHITKDTDLRDPDEGPCRAYSDPGGSIWNWDDCISSVRVAPGWRAILYEDGFEGNQLEVTRDISNLQLAPGKCDNRNSFNDCVTSIRVFSPS